MCVCIGVAAFVGYLSAQLGFETPKTKKGAILSGVLTATTTGVATVAIKTIFHTPICGGTSRPLFDRVISALGYTVPIALISSLALNYLVAHYIEPALFAEKGCCKKKAQQEPGATKGAGSADSK